jgi:1,4-alpha-glucan branching enzyme
MLLPALAALTVLAAADNNVEWNGLSHQGGSDRRPLAPLAGETFEVRFQAYQGDLTAARVHVDDGTETWVTASVAGQRGPYDVWAAQIPVTVANVESYWIELTDGTDVDYLSATAITDGVPVDGGWVLNFTTLEHAPVGATPTNGGGTVFRVWAPGATTAHVRGTFNGWSLASPMTKYGEHFIRWVSNANAGAKYKYFFDSAIWKSDPRGRAMDAGDNYNTIIANPFAHTWGDGAYETPQLQELVIYQAHVGTFSGRNDPLGTPSFPGGYTDLAARVGHLVELGVNCVMLCPITEFPGDESAGYNPITAWAPEWAYGTPDEFKALVDTCHQNGIAVLLDIVWNHFSATDNYLWDFDGSQIYFDAPAVETPWGSQADFDHPEVRSYFVESAALWFDEYHIDGFRMDATDFMNMPPHGAAGWYVMQQLNDLVDHRYADKIVIAEQLPDDPWVTRPTSIAGAGFDSQYNDDFTDRLREEIFDAAVGDPEMWKIQNITNGNGQYLEKHWVTNYVELHDETWPTSGGQRMVVSIDTTFPHDDVFAAGRTKLAQGVTFTAPGVPAMLMGTEWLEDTGFGTGSGDRIDWSKKTTYAGVFQYYQDLIALRKTNSALWSDAFHQVSHVNEGGNVIAYRRANFAGEDLIVVANFSNGTYNGYRFGVPLTGNWEEVLNSQATTYGGTGPDNSGALASEAVASDAYGNSIVAELPARSLLVFRHQTGAVDAPVVAGAGIDTGLRAVRPNPARGERTIDFSVARTGNVVLDVVDAAGRRVARVLDGTMEAGAHTAAWNGRDGAGRPVAAGVYFARLVVEGGTMDSRKIVVLK